ncbi:MAG: CYTH domain-containing protein [Pseudolabrys sp.]|nr:CYTH domain-containing protein [Pseudolabrys sp.]MBV9261865.1 CYTH domain-containing protein [Pseudolabrys sp.]
MAKEIERKFLVHNDGWKKKVRRSHKIVQAYLASTRKTSVRVRVIDGKKAFVTIKSAKPGRSRDEFEYRIPVNDARALIRLRQGVTIVKRRYHVLAGRRVWEIDVFGGAHKGLVIAEIELQRRGDKFARPDWLGREVTHDRRYYNAALARA